MALLQSTLSVTISHSCISRQQTAAHTFPCSTGQQGQQGPPAQHWQRHSTSSKDSNHGACISSGSSAWRRTAASSSNTVPANLPAAASCPALWRSRWAGLARSPAARCVENSPGRACSWHGVQLHSPHSCTSTHAGGPPAHQPAYGAPAPASSASAGMSSVVGAKLQKIVSVNQLGAFYPPDRLQAVTARVTQSVDFHALAARCGPRVLPQGNAYMPVAA